MDARFQVCFTPLAAVLFAFPSRYLFAIGTCSALLGILVGPVGLSAMGLSPAAAQLSSCVRLAFPVPCPSPATPGSKLPGLGSCAFARRYLRNVV